MWQAGAWRVRGVAASAAWLAGEGWVARQGGWAETGKRRVLAAGWGAPGSGFGQLWGIPEGSGGGGEDGRAEGEGRGPPSPPPESGEGTAALWPADCLVGALSALPMRSHFSFQVVLPGTAVIPMFMCRN